MKVKIEDDNIQGFKPINLLITIESKRELEFLWGIFNNTDEDQAKYVNKGLKDEPHIKKFTIHELEYDIPVTEIWAILDNNITE